MAAVLLLAALLLGPLAADSSGDAESPVYSADSIANSAASIAAYYAPNTFISIYGQNLATVTRQLTSDDIAGGMLPTTLGGVHVLINSTEANIWYVSPALVNLLIPALLVPGPATVQLVSNGIAGPAIQVNLGATAPAIFPADATNVIASHLNGTQVTTTSPAHGGEWVVLWAGGLGPTVPPAIPNELERRAAPLGAPLQVFLNGVPVDPQRVNYVGSVAGYAGLFQINLLLPDDVAANPEIRLATPDRISPAQRFLPVQ